ncbi:hypothetical protein OIU84_009969 [Salix udensis]|uniref:Uncharacterized protein n=1 Tax=Salix udensis TaxID=889485 RepID=A0AAD6JKB5_9ROSI|nr:hypothetical protein OIU84_009969 [Salix udensis]
MLLVTEAWRATGMTKEASGTLGTINKMEMSCQKETGKQIPVGKTVSKANSRFPVFQYLAEHKCRKGRMVLRDDFQCMLMACHKNLSLSHSCKFGVRLLKILKKKKKIHSANVLSRRIKVSGSNLKPKQNVQSFFIC